MASNFSTTRRRPQHRRKVRNSSSSEEIETIALDTISSPVTNHHPTAIHIPSEEQVDKTNDKKTDSLWYFHASGQ